MNPPITASVSSEILPPACFQELKERIANHTAKVGVVGLGYVGLPFAVEKAKVGFDVIGIEQNPKRAARVNKADNYISDVKDEELKALVEVGKIKAFSGFAQAVEMDVIVICAPTPLTKNHRNCPSLATRATNLPGIHNLSWHHR